MIRKATAVWNGSGKEGHGHLTTQSTVLNESQYSYKTRFEEGEKGTDPEELLAAAHAGCFTMAIGAQLGRDGFNPTSLDTQATLTLEGLNVTGIPFDPVSGASFALLLRRMKSIGMVSALTQIAQYLHPSAKQLGAWVLGRCVLRAIPNRR